VITKEEDKTLLPSSSGVLIPKVVIVPPEEIKPLEKKGKRPRSQTFNLPGFSLKSSNTDTQLPRESDSPPTSPAESTSSAGIKGTILVCPDLEKQVVEKISIMSTTTSQVLIQNSEFLLGLIPKEFRRLAQAKNFSFFLFFLANQFSHALGMRPTGTHTCCFVKHGEKVRINFLFRWSCLFSSFLSSYHSSSPPSHSPRASSSLFGLPSTAQGESDRH